MGIYNTNPLTFAKLAFNFFGFNTKITFNHFKSLKANVYRQAAMSHRLIRKDVVCGFMTRASS